MWFLIYFFTYKRSCGAPYFSVTVLDQKGPSASSVQEGASPNRQSFLSQTLDFLYFPLFGSFAQIWSRTPICLKNRPLIRTHRSAVWLRNVCHHWLRRWVGSFLAFHSKDWVMKEGQAWWWLNVIAACPSDQSMLSTHPGRPFTVASPSLLSTCKAHKLW